MHNMLTRFGRDYVGLVNVKEQTSVFDTYSRRKTGWGGRDATGSTGCNNLNVLTESTDHRVRYTSIFGCGSWLILFTTSLAICIALKSLPFGFRQSITVVLAPRLA
jgi:hypothetical protein